MDSIEQTQTETTVVAQPDAKPVVGFIGLGKLGLPVALAVENKGYDVIGTDTNPEIAGYVGRGKVPYKEEFVNELLPSSKLRLVDLPELVARSGIIFLAVQTPHQAKYEGDTRLPDDRADFDYSYLINAVAEVADQASRQEQPVTLVVISTCLPGTFERDIKPLLNDYIDYIYNPFFIAMGTVIKDFLNPEFVLLGIKNEDQAQKMAKFYNTIHLKPVFYTDFTTAEGIKVFYNTFITMKTVFANMTGEMAYKLGMNADHIFQALSLATDRLVSNRYMKAGMGDGGGCHPRDNIALSHLARQVKLSHNIFEDFMKAREDHTEWLADLAIDAAQKYELPLILLGKSFKPQTNITTGSPAVLMANILKEKKAKFKHYENLDPEKPAVYFIATQHDKYNDYTFPEGSRIIDPFRFMLERKGVDIIRIG